MVDYRTALLDKIDAREARVAVIGLGYVGLPTTRASVAEGDRLETTFNRVHGRIGREALPQLCFEEGLRQMLEG